MTEVKLPRIDESINESMVIFWHKQEGDQVSKGDVLVEVQTEKAVTEIEAEQDGILKEILIKRGEVASVGDVLCLLGKEGEEKDFQDQRKESMETSLSRKDQDRPFVRVAPRLRRLAKDLNVDLVEVQKATDGKITEEAIHSFAKEGKSVGEPLTGIRKRIAERMKDSLTNSAQLTETAYADVTKLAEVRENYKKKISWNSWILLATIKALEAHSYMNGTFENNMWYESTEINLGVATDTESGLIVPVIKKAEEYTIETLDKQVAKLAEKARNNALTPEQMTGSTFTVTNLGGYGIHFFTPIINPPEIAILGIGQIEKYLVLEEGEIKERLRLPLSLTFDHQVIDGAPAARFLQTLIQELEDPREK